MRIDYSSLKKKDVPRGWYDHSRCVFRTIGKRLCGDEEICLVGTSVPTSVSFNFGELFLVPTSTFIKKNVSSTVF